MAERRGSLEMKDIAKNFKMRLFINNKLIPLKPFLSNFVKQIILSMVFNLKDTGKPEKIELILEKAPEEGGEKK